MKYLIEMEEMKISLAYLLLLLKLKCFLKRGRHRLLRITHLLKKLASYNNFRLGSTKELAVCNIENI